MWHHDAGEGRWTAGSAEVDGNLESDHPTWIMWAAKGKHRIYLASGPLISRALAEHVAAELNATDPERWDHFIEHALRDVLTGNWG